MRQSRQQITASVNKRTRDFFIQLPFDLPQPHQRMAARAAPSHLSQIHQAKIKCIQAKQHWRTKGVFHPNGVSPNSSSTREKGAQRLRQLKAARPASRARFHPGPRRWKECCAHGANHVRSVFVVRVKKQRVRLPGRAQGRKVFTDLDKDRWNRNRQSFQTMRVRLQGGKERRSR